MATYINKNGKEEILTAKVIKEIRKSMVEEIERRNYEKLSDQYKKMYTLESWLKFHIVGRLFMIGYHDNDTWSEFYKIFGHQSEKIALSVVKDWDDAKNIVIEQFCMFHSRKLYSNCKEIVDQRILIDDLKKQLKKKEKEATTDDYNENVDYMHILNVEIPAIEKEIEKEQNRHDDMERRESSRECNKIQLYDGLTEKEIYDKEKEEMTTINSCIEWYSNELPIAGYIYKSVLNLSKQFYIKKKNDKVIIASRLQKNGVNKDEELTEDDIMDIAHAKNQTDLFDYIMNDDFENKEIEIFKIDTSDIMEDSFLEYGGAITAYQEMAIKRFRELCGRCGDKAQIMEDFIFNGLSQNKIKEKYGFNSEGAIKSIVSRTRMKVCKQLNNEINSQKIRDYVTDSGTLYQYYDCGVGIIKETIEVKNRKRHGENIQYYENGQIKIKRSYKNGKLDGGYIKYHENGTIKISGSYKNGVKSDIWKRGSKNRVLEEEVLYLEDGSYIYTIFDDNGRIEDKGHCDENGELVEIATEILEQLWKNAKSNQKKQAGSN